MKATSRAVEVSSANGANVGESLDWSAPQLFAQLGPTMEDLVASGAATFKRHITVTAPDGSQHEYLPGDWLTAPPWNVETRTCTWIACRCTTGCNSQHALTELLRFTSGLLDSRFEIGGSRPSRPRQDIAFEPPGLSTRPALQPACSEKNSACRSLLTDRLRLRSGHISPPKTGSKRPLSTCSARSANIWSGFGRFPSAPASAALGISHPDRKSSCNAPTALKIPICFGSKCRSSRA